jgi:hypothetical protein
MLPLTRARCSEISTSTGNARTSRVARSLSSTTTDSGVTRAALGARMSPSIPTTTTVFWLPDGRCQN